MRWHVATRARPPRAAKAAAAKLHELARQVKGELALEVAAELAMARDLADEMAQKEGEFGDMPEEAPASGAASGQGQDKGAAGNAGTGTAGRGGGRRSPQPNNSNNWKRRPKHWSNG